MTNCRALKAALFLILLYPFAVSAQNGIVRMKETNIGTENTNLKVTRTFDNKYIVLQQSNYPSTSAIIKYDTAFNVIWQTNLGGGLNDLIQTSDSGFVAVGTSRNAGISSSDDLWVLRLDKSGSILWQKFFFGAGSEFGRSVKERYDGNLVVLATTNSTDGDIQNKTTNDYDLWLLELSPTGAMINQKIFGGTAEETQGTLYVDPLGKVTFAAGTASNDGPVTGNHGSYDVWLVSLDASYNIQWSKCFGGSGEEHVNSFSRDSAGDYVIAGKTTSADGDFIGGAGYDDGFLLKLDGSGNKRWSRLIAGTYYDELLEARILPNNDIIAIGYSASDFVENISIPVGHGFDEIILLRISPGGEMIWTRSIGGSSAEHGFSTCISASGQGFIIGGWKWFTGNDGDFAGIVPAAGGENRALLLEIKNLNAIKGIVYSDDNNNNIKDVGETFFTAGKIESAKGAFKQVSLLNTGHFLFSVDTGTYVTRFVNVGAFDSTQYAISPKKKTSTFSSNSGSDSFAIRIVPIGLVKDLEVTMRQLSPSYIDHSVRYRVTLKNIGGQLFDSAFVKLILDPKTIFQSATIPINFISGDTVRWKFTNLASLTSDSFDVIVRAKTFPGVHLGDMINLQAYAEPYATDFDSSDNYAAIPSVILGQNAAITNISFNAKVIDSARIGRIVPYTLTYNFLSQLDSTKGVIQFVKDPHTSFVSANPQPISVANDTISWNFKDLSFSNTDTVVLNLKIEGAGLAVGSSIHHTAKIRFDATDTLALERSAIINQRITGYFTPMDTDSTTLEPPHGIRWTRSFGSLRSEFANDVIALADSGFIVVGQTDSADVSVPPVEKDYDGLITRFNKDGRVIWTRTFIKPRVQNLHAVIASKDGNYFAVGESDIRGIDAWVIKFNSNGDTLWSRMFGGSNPEIAYSVVATADGGCVFVGEANSNDGDVHGYITPASNYTSNLWVVKLNSSGMQEWDKCFTNVTEAYNGTDIVQTFDGSFIVTGLAIADFLPTAVTYGLVLKLDMNGNKIWEKTFRQPSINRTIEAVIPDGNNAFVAVGRSAPFGFLSQDTTYSGIHGQGDVWVLKFDGNGDQLWEKFFGGSFDDFAKDISMASDGTYLISGATKSRDGNVTNLYNTNYSLDGWLLKVDASGKLLWQKTVGGNGSDQFNSAVELMDKTLLAVGSTSSNDRDISNYIGGSSDILLTKIGLANFITGKIFYDKNGNGLQDTDDPDFERGLVQAQKESLLYAGVPVNGSYHVSVDTGNFVLRLITSDSNYYNIVPSLATTTFSQYSQTDTINFRLVKKADINDLFITLLPQSAARPGSPISFLVKYENRGTVDIQPVTLKIKIGQKTEFVNSTLPYSSVINDTLIWNLPQVNILESHSFNLSLKVKPPPSTTIGETISIVGEILPIATDSLPSDNTSTVNMRLQGSYDPNDKTEVHGGRLNYAPGSTEYLTYIIRFQNTGTDTAFNVYVRDTLDNKLDWNSFEMIASSHNYSLQIDNGNKLEWYFKDILLPDSNVNESASHGFIAFRIKPKSGLQLSDTINNLASVYFDFNSPVATNVVQTTLAPNVSLPSTIIGFSARWKQTNTALITWNVVSEYKVAYYLVERSTDGRNFSAIGKVEARNLGGAQRYEFTDASALANLNYFRLQTVDVDGHKAYSKIVVLNKDDNELLVYPNPAQDKIHYSIPTFATGGVRVFITDVNGKTVFVEEFALNSQTQVEKTINISRFASGAYVLNVQVGNKKYRIQFVKH